MLYFNIITKIKMCGWIKCEIYNGYKNGYKEILIYYIKATEFSDSLWKIK